VSVWNFVWRSTRRCADAVFFTMIALFVFVGVSPDAHSSPVSDNHTGLPIGSELP
jgi:hypothetical protein